MYSIFNDIKAKVIVTVLIATVAGLCAWFIIAYPVSADSGYTFTAPNNISLEGMVPRTYTGSAIGSFTGNNSTGYTITAQDLKSTNEGYMVSGTNVLHNKFKIGATAGSVADADTAQTLLNTNTSATDVSVPLFVSQQIVYNDPIANGYTITITYTVTAK